MNILNVQSHNPTCEQKEERELMNPDFLSDHFVRTNLGTVVVDQIIATTSNDFRELRDANVPV
jgi:hypothetical protein